MENVRTFSRRGETIFYFREITENVKDRSENQMTRSREAVTVIHVRDCEQEKWKGSDTWRKGNMKMF